MTETNIIPLSSIHVHKAAKIYTDIFLSDEPTSIRHNLDPEVFFPYAEAYVQLLVPEELSFVAVDTVTSEMVGFVFCWDFSSDITKKGEKMAGFLEHFKATIALMDMLEEEGGFGDNIPAGSVLHVFQIGVIPQNRRAGVAQSLIQSVLNVGYKKGFQKVIADCTSERSAHTFRSCGFTKTGEIQYETFNSEGDCFFAGLPGEISLMTRNIR